MNSNVCSLLYEWGPVPTKDNDMVSEAISFIGPMRGRMSLWWGGMRKKPDTGQMQPLVM